MKPDTSNLKSSIIISVYTDHIALNLILESLKQQTSKSYEIIISEDGESNDIKNCISQFETNIPLQHLTQEDKGFRKNIALNRAIKASTSEHLIFIDGDCVPHPKFIAAHQAYTQTGYACTGRRLELGKKISDRLRTKQRSLNTLTNRLLYFANIFSLLLDKAKNIESGIYSKLLFKLTRNREIRLLGCNFSCNKQDLLKINGFNEEYIAAGIGEDSDIDWRLTKSGVKIKNVKFSAIQYHLYHPRLYHPSKENEEIFKRTKKLNLSVCEKGLSK